jgi:hypothetical protein
MKKIIFTILLLVFSASSFFGQTSSITNEEYEFYSNLLSQKSVIFRNTYVPEISYLQYTRKKISNLPQELINDFNLKNNKSYQIEDKLGAFRFSDHPRPDLDKAKEIVFIFDAFETVSRVGFTKDKKQALIYHLHSFEGPGSAYGGFYWYIRKNDEWKIKKYVAVPIF